MPKPLQGTYPKEFHNYISQVPQDDLDTAFAQQQKIVDEFFPAIVTKADYAYAAGKWTLKEMLQHIIDGERIFNYRALAIARKETISLPGFEENMYAANSNANARDWEDLCEEFKTVRKSTVYLYNSFTDAMLSQMGTANNNPVMVAAIGFTTIGHLYHHKKVIEERYLPEVGV